MFPYERPNPQMFPYERLNPFYSPYEKLNPFYSNVPIRKTQPLLLKFSCRICRNFLLKFFFPKNHPNHFKRRLTHSTLSFFIIPFSLYPFFIIPLSLFPFTKDLTSFTQMTSFYKKINYERLNLFRRKIF